MSLPALYRHLAVGEKRDVRNKYVALQKGLCWYCSCPLAEPAAEIVRHRWINKRLFPKGFFDYPVHLHHDHETGYTVGAVHNICNAVLWQYEGK